MQLVKQVTLIKRGSSSNKLYEVDLAQVSQGFLVNFRFGKEGGLMREGTKTTSAVREAQATTLFNALAQSKLDIGYEVQASIGDISGLSAGATTSPSIAPAATGSSSPRRSVSATTPLRSPSRGTPSSAPSRGTTSQSAHGTREQTLLHYIQNPAAIKKWSLGQVIWRAGELGIGDAAPLLFAHARTDNKMVAYSIAWALGRIGNTSDFETLNLIIRRESIRPHAARLAKEATRMILCRSGREQEVRNELLPGLPSGVRGALEAQDAQRLAGAIEYEINRRPNHPERYDIYEQLYQLNDPLSRPLILDFVITCAMTTPAFRIVRHLFKVAELRLDAQMFGEIARRFTVTKHNYNIAYGCSWGKDSKGRAPRTAWIRYNRVTRDDVTRANTSYAYSLATRQYMRRRVWRTLRRMGEVESPHYVRMATGVLVAFCSQDKEEPRQSSSYHYDRRARNWVTTHKEYDEWASRLSFNHILREHDPRFSYKPGAKAWVKSAASESNAPEAFSALWDEQPQAALHLIDESNIVHVHELAVRVLKRNPEFCSALPVEALLVLLECSISSTAAFGLTLFERMWDPSNPDVYALARIASSVYAPAREKALGWLGSSLSVLKSHPQALATLVASIHPSVRSFVSGLGDLLTERHVVEQVIAMTIASILGFEAHQNDHAKHMVETLGGLVGDALKDVGGAVIQDLTHSKLEAAQLLGVLILSRQPAHFMNPNAIKGLIASPHASVRRVALNIFGTLSEAILLDAQDLLLALAVHSEQDLRQGVFGPVERLAKLNAEFGRTMVEQLLNILRLKEPSEGVHDDIVSLLAGPLRGPLNEMGVEGAFALLRVKSSAAKFLGGELLQANVDPARLDLARIAELCNNEIVSVRQAGMQFLASQLDRVKSSGLTVLRVVDSDWDDTRHWAFEFFEQEFDEQDWTPELLVSLCDSIREDVQRWGRRMIQLFFKEDDGEFYLLRLSEHPSADLQMFATNYLEAYASDKPEHLAKMEFYFTSVLSRVNKGGVAKARVFEFFSREAAKSEHAARIIGGILGRQSATIAITDRARAIATMTTILQTYPHLDLPLTLKSTEVRHGI